MLFYIFYFKSIFTIKWQFLVTCYFPIFDVFYCFTYFISKVFTEWNDNFLVTCYFSIFGIDGVYIGFPLHIFISLFNFWNINNCFRIKWAPIGGSVSLHFLSCGLFIVLYINKELMRFKDFGNYVVMWPIIINMQVVKGRWTHQQTKHHCEKQ